MCGKMAVAFAKNSICSHSCALTLFPDPAAIVVEASVNLLLGLCQANCAKESSLNVKKYEGKYKFLLQTPC
jgi:hypothetical protein